MARIIYFIFVGLMIAACSNGSQTDRKTDTAEPVSIFNCTWQWESTTTPQEKITVPDPERYTLIFSEDGKAMIKFDCNNGRGNFTITGNQLSFSPLISTRMACPEDSLDAPFMKDLQRVASFFIKDNNLFLELPFDSGTMKFRLEADDM